MKNPTGSLSTVNDIVRYDMDSVDGVTGAGWGAGQTFYFNDNVTSAHRVADLQVVLADKAMQRSQFRFKTYNGSSMVTTMINDTNGLAIGNSVSQPTKRLEVIDSNGSRMKFYNDPSLTTVFQLEDNTNIAKLSYKSDQVNLDKRLNVASDIYMNTTNKVATESYATNAVSTLSTAIAISNSPNSIQLLSRIRYPNLEWWYR